MDTRERFRKDITVAPDDQVGPDHDRLTDGDGRIHRFRRSKAAKSADASESPEATIAALHAELILLREENAWLKAAQHQTSGIGDAIQRVRALPGERTADNDREDDATQALVDAHVLRESLVELCTQMQHALTTAKAQLAELTYQADAFDVFEDPAHSAAVIHITGAKHEAG